LVLTAIVAASNFKSDNEPFITKQFTLKHEDHTYQTYSFEEHPFKNYTKRQIKKLLGLRQMSDKTGTPMLPRGNASQELPEAFNSLTQWPECVHQIRDQGHCGSCWAHAASEVLSDRYCIASNKTVNVVLSPQEMVSCDYMDLGCNGGILTMSWVYLRMFGIATEQCKPYKSGDGTVPSCPWFEKKCEDGSTYKKYKASSFYWLLTINGIKESLMTKGPVETGFSVYEDFMSYKGGVYKRQSSNMLGGHAVKIVGWGKENGEEHWIVANSWGSSWGEKGYFRIAFGECGFDSTGMIAGDPSL